MSRLADELRAIKIYNQHELLYRFGSGKDVAVEYSAGEHKWGAPKTAVYSPNFETNPDAAWYDYKKKTFIGKRGESFQKAIDWASNEYGITDWVVSPFGGRVPKHVLERAKLALKGDPQ